MNLDNQATILSHWGITHDYGVFFESNQESDTGLLITYYRIPRAEWARSGESVKSGGGAGAFYATAHNYVSGKESALLEETGTITHTDLSALLTVDEFKKLSDAGFPQSYQGFFLALADGKPAAIPATRLGGPVLSRKDQGMLYVFFTAENVAPTIASEYQMTARFDLGGWAGNYNWCFDLDNNERGKFHWIPDLAQESK